jgi:GT2 family glycosyltransferase
VLAVFLHFSGTIVAKLANYRLCVSKVTKRVERETIVRAFTSFDNQPCYQQQRGSGNKVDARYTVSADETIYCNARHAGAAPALSVGSPYFRDDPTGWVNALARDPRADGVEIVLVDDGTGDAELDQKVRAAVDAWPGPAMVVRFHTNKGRSAARNRGIRAARGAYLLFIDADMLPGDDRYLSRYFDVIDRDASAIVFGGFTTLGVEVTPDTKLNYSLALKNDCKPAYQRAVRGPLSVASNNLLVRRDVFDHEQFDDGFVGWGWEDTEWAMRAVYAGYGLTHIDNPAVHVGLDTDQAVLRKYKEAGQNLRRLLERHPEGMQMAGAKLAKFLTTVPLHEVTRPALAWIATDRIGLIPMQIRRLATKLWRASHAADALKAR